MERKCADVIKEALMLHTKEINDLMHQAEHWKQKCDIQQNQKQRLQDECKTLESKTISLQSTIESLKEQIQDLKESHRELPNLNCKMCDHLQRMNNSLTEAYSNNLKEKDRRITDLENQLFEYMRNATSEKQWDTTNNTPNKPRKQHRASLNNSLRSESPDSTSRNTPNKPDLITRKSAVGTSDDENKRSSSDGDKASKVSPGNEKGPKLRLKSRKRNRYTEDPDIITVYQENLPEKTEGSEGFCHKETRVPDTEAVGQETSTSDSESDTAYVTGNRYSLRSSLFSPSSEESDSVLKSPKKKDEKRSKKESLSNSVKHDGANKSSIIKEKKVKTSERVLSLGERGDGYIQSSPIFQVYSKSSMESPDVNRREACGDSDVGSPLLLRVTRTEDLTSPAQTRLFDEDCITSPAANTSFKNLSQSRRKGKLNQSKLTSSQDRKKKMEAGENWLNATKPVMKDSPTMRQSTLSQVFMNVHSKPQPEKTTETEDIQKAIQLSLKDMSNNQRRKSSETSDVKIIEKENFSPFKRPLTPRKCKNNAQKQNSPKVKKRNKRSPSIDCDPDETVAPGSLNPGPAELSQDQVSVVPALNGSIDPGVQLSLLCDDSQSLKSDDLPDIDPDPAGESSHVGNLTDFRIEDLRKSTNPLTSTCIDVDDPHGGGEEESQSIPCSMKFGGGRKRFIRIPENFSEEPSNNVQSLEDVGFIPEHEDSFDRIPSKEQPNFAHVEVVRKQDERRKLPAHKCDECREYYEGLGLSEEEIQKRMQTCSRHRAKHAAPGTPEHFWDIGMEDTLECEERGYVHTKDLDKEKPRFRRKRQLNKMF